MFETPLFLLAAVVGASVPLILHLMQKWRSHPVSFPTLRFLQMAQHAAARRIRMQHFLLWLLRTAIMLFLGAAFALPVIRAIGGGMLGRAARDVGIVLDTSYTMAYDLGDQTAFVRAVDAAVSLIENLQEGDRFFVVLAGQEPMALIAEPIRDKQAAIAQLRELTPGYTTSYLLPAVELVRGTLREHAGRRQKELHVFTDNRAQAWTATGGALSGEDKGHADIPTFVLATGVSAPENVSLMDIEIDPAVVSPDGGNRLRVQLGASGRARETVVQLFIHDAEQARRSVSVTPEAGGEASFTLPPLEHGVHIGRIAIPADNLTIDDTFHFLLHVGETVPSLIVGSERESLFLRAALRAVSGVADGFTRVERENLSLASLDAYGVVFLCDALPLPGEEVARLERYVREGGLLVLFPGLRAALRDYEVWNILPAWPRAFWQFDGAEARQALVWEDHAHPLLLDLDAVATAPQVTMERALVMGDLQSDAAVLIRLRNGLPLLLERRAGPGSVMLFSIGADRIWSNFPLTPFYLPVIAQLVEYGRGARMPAPYALSGTRVALDAIMPGMTSETTLQDQEGRAVSIRHVVQEGQAVSYLVEALAPGVYYRPDRGQPEPVLAVNLDRRNSNLVPLPDLELAGALGQARVVYATSWAEMDGLLRSHRVGYSLGELLLWVALILIVMEFVYANHLGQKAGIGSGPAVVDAAGKLHGLVMPNEADRRAHAGS